ncbi:adenylate/guanylate cyclase domain-containing protein [Arenibacter aquaticus]|uniref:Adenylate/guanylate cyclase domain-containing protein n=1 Tax=Arenibacter aquaticus TaxID=2489054 RepID=A0A430K416_9FLAO|nr:adenylate/guanylate cyclase domain-containing protein [Arenibacter aquaticus]RTE53852.1 adenylate/guanylate cyclase domain-containing protein [Arenibacter aquaticus]
MSLQLSAKVRRNLSRIIPFGIIWLVSGWVFYIVEQAAVGNSDQDQSSRIVMNFEVFLFSSVALMAVGLLIGTIELLYLNQVFSKKSFTKKIVYKTIFYILLLLIITAITYPIAKSLELKTSIFDKRVWDIFWEYWTSISHLSTDIQLATSLLISLFYSEISENIGHGVLRNFFTGKYHTPTEELRIFMFSDMKSSTAIAEQLGHIKYFELLKEYYSDFSEAIINHSGEIYQYVGDEIIISWKYEVGIVNNNCIKCFFAMKRDLHKRAEWYSSNYGITPTFKAGFHCGEVTTGEIGELKKEIIFTGDVLNTTARIQGLCNPLNVDILVSGDLCQSLPLESEFKIQSLGINELKGKEQNMELFTITS